MPRRLTREEFIDRTKEIHRNTYDYSLVKYVTSKTKVKILCSKHGVFEQMPEKHLIKQGCPKCVGKNKTTKDFINQAKKVHKDKFDYSLVEYNTGHTKVKIICPAHGVFYQQPYSHLQGQGCRKCKIDNMFLTKEEFIEQAKRIHGNTYDYSKVCYTNNLTKIVIICPLHGGFYQTPNCHISAQQGCKKCAACPGRYKKFDFLSNKQLKDSQAIFYLIEICLDNIKYNKIGITKRLVKKRFSGYVYRLLFTLNTTLYNAWCIEQFVLENLKQYRMQQRIEFSGWSEILLTDEDTIKKQIFAAQKL